MSVLESALEELKKIRQFVQSVNASTAPQENCLWRIDRCEELLRKAREQRMKECK